MQKRVVYPRRMLLVRMSVSNFDVICRWICFSCSVASERGRVIDLSGMSHNWRGGPR
jgi:hypothetical protein